MKVIDSSYFLKKSHLKITRVLAYFGIPNIFYSSYASEFWKTRGYDSKHSPEIYTKPDRTTCALLDPLLNVLDKNASFLEVGCNAGRNLSYLYNKGIRNLTGIEINKIAIEDCLRKTFPELYKDSTLLIGNATEEIKKLSSSSFDVVFANAVLIHVPPSRTSIFEEMVRVSKKYIAVFSADNPPSSWPYDIQRMFERYNCKQVYYQLLYDDSSDQCNIPIDLYDKHKHYFSENSIRIFIKKDS